MWRRLRCSVLVAAAIAILVGMPGASSQRQNGMLSPDMAGSGSGSSSGSGSGSGGVLIPDQVSCQFLQLNFEIFNTAAELYRSLSSQCSNANPNTPPTLTIRLQNVVLESSDNTLLIEHLSMGQNSVSITACGMTCEDAVTYSVTVNVTHSTSRLFPYGVSAGDDSFTGVLDGAVPIYICQDSPVPFFSQYYERLYLTTNGFVTFGQQYTSWWPIPFPFGNSDAPIIAPFWADFNYNIGNPPSSKIFYHVYNKNDGPSRLNDAIFTSLSERVAASDSMALGTSVEFDAEWMAVITWNDAVPFYRGNNLDESITFQLVLATDYTQTYAFYLYGDSTLNIPDWQRVVIGYDSRDRSNHRTINLGSRQDYSQINNVQGNTGKTGEWLFDFTSSDPSAESRCLSWSRKQETGSIVTSELPHCPCTREQALNDFRFWFAYYWGLSRENCAIVLFSRSNSTVECCYDSTSGALLVGPSDGGTYLLYNPLFFYERNLAEDLSPIQDCCVNSMRCKLFYQIRQYDDCSSYEPPALGFSYGDPHFTTVDNVNYTFNGIGEYIFVRTTPSLNFHIQGRLTKFDSTSNGTIISAIAVKQGNIPAVQVEYGSGTELDIYVGGVKQDIKFGDSPIVISSSGILSTDVSGGISSIGAASTSSMMFLRVDEDSNMVISTSEGASIFVGNQEEFLRITVEVPPSFINQTSGMLGVFNNNPDDDFQGAMLNIDASNDRDVYQFGLAWHLTEAESFFDYSIGNTSYSAINNGYMDHLPSFTEDIVAGISAEIIQACMNDLKCVYDYAVTGNKEVGISTLNISMNNDALSKELDNSPPVISGNFTFFGDYGQTVTYTYSVADPDGDDISSFELKTPVPGGFTTSTNGNTIGVTWSSPGLFLLEHPLQLFSRDTEEGATVRTISVVLCACINGGTCLRNDSLLSQAKFDENNYYKWPCNCSEFFGGNSCEIDMRGCGEFSACPDPAMCRNDSTLPSGYACDQCMDGFELSNTKCIDIDECSNGNPCGSNEVCRNSEGNFSCACSPGFRRNPGGQFCEDIDECSEGMSNCPQLCSNNLGSFVCGCQDGFMLDPDGYSCDPSGCTNNLCGGGLDCVVVGASTCECLCPAGEHCTGGQCRGSEMDISSSLPRTCEACPQGTAGLRCNSSCICGSNGRCNISTGCVCSLGWAGTSCNIELNEHSPIFNSSTPSNITIRWDLTQSSPAIITISASDADMSSTAGAVTYSLLPSSYPQPPGVSNGTNIFQIDPATGMLSLLPSASPLSQYSQTISEFLLTIQASDRGDLVRTSQHTLTVIPVPVPHFEEGSRMVAINEEVAQGTQVLDLNCTEIGRPSASSIVRLTGNGATNFIVEKKSSTFSLVVARRIDYEKLSGTVRGFDLTASCSNSYGLSDMITIRVNINNIDDNTFAFESTPYTATIPENATNGEDVLSVRAFDRDFPNAVIAYHTNSSLFRFVPSTDNVIVLVGSLDRETADEYLIALTAEYNTTAGRTVQAFSSILIRVSDVNDNAPRFSLPGYFINNVTTKISVGDHVITIAASDTDIGPNSEVRYYISETNQNFSIDPNTGDIFVSSVLFPRTYEFTVLAVDIGVTPLSSSSLAVVNVQPYPNSVVLTIPDSTVNENIPIGSQVARAQVRVIDYSGVDISDTSQLDVTFEIHNGTNGDRFVIADTGEIFTLESLDYDSVATEYELLLQATVSNADSVISDQAVATIFVTNIDDNPPRFMPQFYAQVVEQFTPQGSSILQVMAADPDRLAPVEYSLENTDAPFQINPASGEIIAVEELRTAQDYRFRVVARDGGTEESTAVVFISVTRPVSVSPVFTKSQFQLTLPENTTPGSYIGAVTAFARNNLSIDYFSHLGYRISTPANIDFNVTNLPMLNASNNLFHIDQTSGNISTQGNFEFDIESRMDFFFYVEVYNVNDDTVYDYATVEIELLDVNDNRPQFSQSLYTRVINTSVATTSVILAVAANDRDSGSNGKVTYSIDTTQGNIVGFALNATSGAISVSNSTLIPGDYYLTIVASDNGSPQLTDKARVFVAVIPSLPTRIEFSEAVYSFELAEDARPPAVVGRVTVVEPNATTALSNVTYSTPNVTNCFGVEATTGEVMLTCTILDRERVSSYELVIEGRVSDTLAVLGTVQISILDVNDNLPDFLLDVYTRVIDDRFGNDAPVVQVMAEDQDSGTNGSILYQIVANTPFRINSTSGEIFLIDNTIEVGDYRLSVYAVDMGIPTQLSSSALILICVTRAYPQTLQFQTTTFNISENEPSLSSVGTVVLVTNGGNLVDPSDFPGNLRFSIVGGDSVNNFTIDEETGAVEALTTFNREEGPVHVVEILANFTQFYNIPVRHIESSFTINIVDVNEEPSLDNLLYEGTIDDTTATGSVIANISATDSDIGLNALLNFGLSRAPSSMFGVRVINTYLPQIFGEIYVANESALRPGMYTFYVIATDQGTPPLSSSPSRIYIVVDYSVPDEIYFSSSDYLFHTPESFGEMLSPETVIGNVSVLPVTPALNRLEYVITGGSGAQYFIIDRSTGTISKRTIPNIDRERVSMFTLNITACLPGEIPPLSTETVVTIAIDDLNDNAPVFNTDDGIYPRIALSTNTPDLDSILNVSASDRDTGRNSEILYSIQTVTLNSTIPVNSAFMVVAQTGEVFTPLNLDIGTYYLTLVATDQGIPPLSATAYVIVIIQRPAPDFIEFDQQYGYNFTLLENLGAGVNVGTVTLQNIPVYLENMLRFSIVQSTDFTIIQNSGVVQNLRQMDYEVEKRFTFTVTVTLADASRLPPLHLTNSTMVTISIEDTNDNIPSFINFPDLITQYEELPTPEVVYTIGANDSDSGLNGRLNFTILNTGLNDILTINSQTGEITASAGLDREDPRLGVDHALIIQVCDMGTPANCATDTVVYRLLDINDNSPRLTSGFTYYVDERSPFRTTAFYFRGTDPDEGSNGTVRFRLNTPPRQVPFWLSTGGRFVFNYFEIDYETTPYINISLNLRDLGTPPMDTNYINITVIVRDLPDNVPQFSEVNYQVNTGPSVSQGSLIATVNATDSDTPSSNDSLVYVITGIMETGNRGVLPLFSINQAGNIFSTRAQEFWPEAQFDVTVLVYDQSRFNLSNTTNVIIDVIPDVLEFTDSEYSVFVPEDLTRDSIVASLSIRNLSYSSDIRYNTEPIQPVGIPNRFTTNGNGFRTVTVSLANDLDREAYATWQVLVTATRSVRTRGTEMASAMLTVYVEDVNDNRPIFTDMSNTIINVVEGVTADTFVTKSNASDLDIGDNSELAFTFVDEPSTYPFSIVSSTGVVRTSGKIDYEAVSSYNMTVLVRDHGNPVMQNRITYIINIININDNHPRFAKPAYFGEVYARAPVNSLVKHTELIVTDPDDVTGEEPLSFNIRQEGFDNQDDYLFQVTSSNPRKIQVIKIADSANIAPSLIRLRIEVTDVGGLTTEVPLYLSIFTSSNLVTFQLDGINLHTFLSCSANQTSMCFFRDTIASVTKTEFQTIRGITFYNNTAEESPDRLNSIIVGLYGWYGGRGSRASRGELESSDPISPVDYITYNEGIFQRVAESDRLYYFTFSVTLAVPTTTVPVTVVTVIPAAPFPIYPIIGVVVGVAVAVVVLVVLVVVVCMLGKRKDKPKKKKQARRPSDPYERSINRLRRKHRDLRSSSEDIALHSTAPSDLAYETMYDDDELVDTNQTMPWFDPQYLASGKDDYDGDNEETLRHAQIDRQKIPPNMRATVDGDARRSRRHSSDESGVAEQSVTDLDLSEYLQGYQTSAPLKPGQQMSELDMFASHRTGADPDKPYRPSLDVAKNLWQGQQQQQLQQPQQQQQEQQQHSQPRAGPSQQRAGPPQQRAGPPQQRTGPPQQRAGPPQQRAGPAQQRAGPAQQRAGPPQQRAGPPQQRAGPPQQRTGPPQQRAGPSQQRAGPSQQRAALSQPRPTPSQPTQQNPGQPVSRVRPWPPTQQEANPPTAGFQQQRMVPLRKVPARGGNRMQPGGNV